MLLTTAMARFVDVSDLIKSRAQVDDFLRDLCEDYQLARQLLLREKKQRPRQAKKIAEYTSLVDELEDEIMRYLIGAEQKPPRE
ncbi:MAG: hypothetical protein M9924_11285 [Rhizobiaceae bacterium]|nr:hypothetical protein [Rhizobiaceae bacterium]